MYARAIVREVPNTISAGITTADLGQLRLNDRVLVAEDYETVGRSIAERGYDVTGLEMAEFRKLDSGLSCLSLRLPELEP